MRAVLVTLLPVFAALLACGYDSEEARSSAGSGGVAGYGGAGGSSNNAAQAPIDTGALLTTEPGQGIGTLLGYEVGGKWHIDVACDTALTSEECFWDIVVEPLNGARIRNVTTEGLEATDDYDWDPGGARLATLTGKDNDGLVVETDPGASLRVDVLLDNNAGNAFVYWISDGAMNRGAPTNPIDLIPSDP